jgi:hypothetical protein
VDVKIHNVGAPAVEQLNHIGVHWRKRRHGAASPEALHRRLEERCLVPGSHGHNVESGGDVAGTWTPCRISIGGRDASGCCQPRPTDEEPPLANDAVKCSRAATAAEADDSAPDGVFSGW